MAANYVTVNSIIDGLEAISKQEDSYLSNTKRPTLIRLARKGLKEFVLKYTNDIAGLRMPVEEGNFIYLPIDYVKYTRISYFTECGTLIPIAVDNRSITANSYLLDNFGEILLDENGIALIGSGDFGINRECTVHKFDYTECPEYGNRVFYSDYNSPNNNYNINPTFKSGVTFVEDQVNNRIQFSGQKLDEVVIEYIFNPYTSAASLDELQINVFFADALEKYVVSECLNQKRNEIVPMNEKIRAKKDFKEALLEAKIHKNMPPLSDIQSITNLR